jgi:hypothetical protein
MLYCVLHYEKGNKINEYTLQATAKTILNERIKEAIKKLRYLGRCKIFYFANYEKWEEFQNKGKIFIF